MSLGGCLALRAASKDPRIKHVVAFDVLYDFYDCMTRHLGRKKGVFEFLLALRLNGMIDRIASQGSKTKSYRRLGPETGDASDRRAHRLLNISKSLRDILHAIFHRPYGQDVLLLAPEDHFIPIGQFHDQIRALTGARSLTARLFTASESAQSHCQIGNIGLALDFILAWIEERQASRHRNGVVI